MQTGEIRKIAFIFYAHARTTDLSASRYFEARLRINTPMGESAQYKTPF